MRVRRWVAGAAAVAAVVTVGGVVGAGAAEARPAPRYRSCAQLHRVYPGGVGMPGARDRVRRGAVPVSGWVPSRAVYQANRRLDGDRDRIACERLVVRRPVLQRPASPRVTAAPSPAPTVTVTPPLTPSVQVRPAVRVVASTGDTITVDWVLTPWADRYELSWVEQGTGRVWVGRRPAYADYRRGPVRLTGLVRGETYVIKVTSFRGEVRGPAWTVAGKTRTS